MVGIVFEGDVQLGDLYLTRRGYLSCRFWGRSSRLHGLTDSKSIVDSSDALAMLLVVAVMQQGPQGPYKALKGP